MHTNMATAKTNGPTHWPANNEPSTIKIDCSVGLLAKETIIYRMNKIILSIFSFHHNHANDFVLVRTPTAVLVFQLHCIVRLTDTTTQRHYETATAAADFSNQPTRQPDSIECGKTNFPSLIPNFQSRENVWPVFHSFLKSSPVVYIEMDAASIHCFLPLSCLQTEPFNLTFGQHKYRKYIKCYSSRALF